MSGGRTLNNTEAKIININKEISRSYRDMDEGMSGGLQDKKKKNMKKRAKNMIKLWKKHRAEHFSALM